MKRYKSVLLDVWHTGNNRFRQFAAYTNLKYFIQETELLTRRPQHTSHNQTEQRATEDSKNKSVFNRILIFYSLSKFNSGYYTEETAFK